MTKEKPRTRQSTSSDALSELIAKGMLEKKAEDVQILDLRNIQNSIVDYFVIGTGNSATQIDAIAESVEEEVYKTCLSSPWHSEGRTNKEWVIIDYVDVVAHVFNKECRQFYDLEGLWGDAKLSKPERVPKVLNEVSQEKTKLT